MELYSVDAGNFLCDGGGIFGSVPKALWSRKVFADENNMIRLAMRCLLIVDGNRKVLIETGAGNKLSEKFMTNNGIENPNQLLESLETIGFKPEDITDVVHTHLHWDHCGGGTRFDFDQKSVVPTFPNATYHSSRAQWENAMNPCIRENDAYFIDDLLPVQKCGQLNLIEIECELFPGFELRFFDGHTPGMIVPIIDFKGKRIVYVSDLAPMAANVALKWVAAYDLLPVIAMKEKEQFFNEVYEHNDILFFEHDCDIECASLAWNSEKGPRINETFGLESLKYDKNGAF